MRSIRSRVALVTGASSGIGRASADALDRAGFIVVGTSRSPAAGSRLRALDVTNSASVASCVEGVMSEHGSIDVLVNNAGVGALAAFEETTIEQAQAVFDTNVFGAMRMTQAVLPHMRSAGQGRIVHISSILGFVPSPYMAAYTASKFAVEGFSEALDHEIREFGIRSILVQPAYTRTGFETASHEPAAPIETYSHQRSVAAEVLSAGMTNADDPAVVAEVVVSAATDAAPRLRYTAGKLSRRAAMLRRFAPSAIVDKQVRKLNRLP